jgi:hypothetical protein
MQTKGIPLGEANVIVRDWLQAHREESMAITRDRIAKETGVSAGQVSKCPAWSAFKCAREKMQKREGGEVQLSSRMEAVVPSNCPMPDELAALIEEQEADEAKDARHGYRHNRRHGPS